MEEEGRKKLVTGKTKGGDGCYPHYVPGVQHYVGSYNEQGDSCANLARCEAGQGKEIGPSVQISPSIIGFRVLKAFNRNKEWLLQAFLLLKYKETNCRNHINQLNCVHCF